MRLASGLLLGVLVVAALSSPVRAQPRPRGPGPMGPPSVTGIWQWRAGGGNRAWGRLFLIQDGPVVRGAFLDSSYGGGGGDLEGNLDGRRLVLHRRGGREPDLVLNVDPSGTRLWGELSAQRIFPAGAGPGEWEVNPPPPPPPPPPAIRPIDENSFNQLLAAIGRESFSENRLSVVRQATSYHYFIVDQVARILPLFSFEDSRLQALEALRPRILDPQNGFKLSELFMSSSARQRAQQIMMPTR